MFRRTAVVSKVGTVDSPTPDLGRSRLTIVLLLVLSAWCGLVAGLFEVGTIVLRKQMLDSDHLCYQDFIFPKLTALKTAVIVSRALDGFPDGRLRFCGGLAGVRRAATLF
jgi:hypothetical protein